MKRRRGEGDRETLAEVPAASLDDDDDEEARSLFASNGYVVVRGLLPQWVLRWLRVECDVLSGDVNLIRADCMVDPLDGVNMMDAHEVRRSPNRVNAATHTIPGAGSQIHKKKTRIQQQVPTFLQD